MGSLTSPIGCDEPGCPICGNPPDDGEDEEVDDG